MSIRIKTVNVLCGLVFGLAPAWAEDTYVTDGLIHRYDGIDNVAVGVHDESQRVWNDLVSTAPINLSMDLNPVNKAVLTAKSVLGKETSHKFLLAAPAEAPSLGEAGVKAFEVVIRSTAYQKNRANTLLARLWKDRSAELILRSNHTIGNDTIGYFPCGGTASNDFTTVTVLIESGKLYLNGVEAEKASSWSKADVQMNKPYYFVLGGEPDNNSYPFEGEIFACRIYTRELDAAEIAANAQTDANRFFPHRTCYVVPEDADSTPTPPYSSWATAAKSLTNALAVVTEGWGEVILSNGIHHVSTPTVTLTSKIVVSGLGGREETILDADASYPPIYLDHPDARMSGLTIQNIHEDSPTLGGNGCLFIARGCVEDCVLRNCVSAKPYVHFYNTYKGNYYAALKRCIITNNTATANLNGAISLRYNARVEDCFIDNNSSRTYGHGENIGVASADVKTVLIRNCTFGVGPLGWQRAFSSGSDDGLAGTFVNCTFLVGPNLSTGREFHLTNCAATQNIEASQGKSGSTVEGMKVMTLAEMDIVDNIGTIGEGSGLIDQGVPYEGIDGEFDLAGNPRMKGGAPDIGCSECQSTTFSASFTCSVTQETVGNDIVFFAQAKNAPAGAALEYDWTFTACGATVRKTVNTAEAAFDDLPAGPCTVALVIRDTVSGASTASFVKEGAVFVRPTRVYVKAAGQAATPVAPYDTEEKALASIDEAVSWCAGLDDIEVALLEGRHTTAGTTMVLTTGITIAGVYGRERTVFDGDQKLPPFLLRNSGACLRGLTIENILNTGSSVVSMGCVGVEDGRVEDCVIRNNTSTYSIITLGTGYVAHDASMSRCIVTNNTRYGTVYGMVRMVNAVRIDNCYIADNDVQYGGTLSADPQSLVYNCTLGDCKHITNNSLPFGCGQVQGLCGNFYNCAFLVEPNYNANLEFHLVNCASVAPFDATKGKAGSTAAGTKVMTLAEMDFLDAARTIGEGSGLIDNGTVYEGVAEMLDLAGNPRVKGGAPDIGCSECQNASFSAAFTCSATQETVGAPVTFVAQVRNAPAGAVLVYDWAFTACGATVRKTADTAEVAFDDLPSGPCTVTLVIRDTAGGTATAPFVKANAVFVRPEKIYVTADPTATPVEPYDTPAKAITNLNEALDWCAGLENIEITLLEGTHYVSGRTTTLTNAVTISGQAGRERTILDACASYPPIYLNHPEAALRGLTLQNVCNVSPTYVADGCVRIRQGLVEDCIIRNNVSGAPHVLLGEMYKTNHAVLNRCIVTNNTATDNLKGCVALWKKARVENCYIADNSCKFYGYGETIDVYDVGAHIRNCTLEVGKNGPQNAFALDQNRGLAGTFVNCAFLVQPTFAAGHEFHATNCAAEVAFDAAAGKAGSTVAGMKVVSPAAMRLGPAGRIKSGSALIDQGVLYDGISELDLFGQRRVSHGIPDIGCSERQLGGLMMIVR